jgi:hypothetical protein
MDRLTKAQMEFMNGYVPASIHDVYEYATGGGIHIDPSKKGTFKAQATRMNMGVQEAASHILANKDEYSSAMVKKANFARNFAKEEGGVARGDQGNAQMMQMIQTYAQMVAQQSGDDPNKVYQELMGQLQQMKPEQQQQAIQQIVKQVQSASQQPAMQMGGDPSQMQQEGGDAEQLIQQIQQMLQQGAQPQEVIAQLLQLQIDPQMIVEIFVQLGMPQEQGVQAVQGVMQQMGGGQEQGMEEPAPQGMKDGGITKYPYGGMYANKKNYANFLPQDALNNAMTDVNMLAMPAAALSATGFKPFKKIAGFAGLASGLAGAFQGYRGLASGALFGKKNKPATSYGATSYNVTGNATSNINPMTSSPVVGPQRFEDLPEAEQKWKGIPHMLQDGGTPNNPGFNALPDYVQEKIIANMEYGGLPTAQVGIPPGFDFKNPFGMQSPRFGQTANYADTRGYTDGQPIRNRSTSTYSTPGFVEGMGVGQEGYGGADNTRYDLNDPNAPTAASIKLYNDQQALGAAGQNTISLTDEQVKNKKGKYDGYAFPENSPESYNKKVNKKTANNKPFNNISGRQMANNALLGLSIFNDSLGDDKRGPRPMTEAERQERLLNNPLNYAGVYTPNVQGGGNDYIPNRYTATQDYGTTGNVIARTGGQMNFAAGGQYKVSHEQLLQLLRDGAEIEFL